MKKLLKADNAPSCIDINLSALEWRKNSPEIEIGIADSPPLLSHILNGKEYGPLLNGPDVARHRDEWRTFIRDMASCMPRNAVLSDRFHTQWHVGHHHIRALVDDDDLLMDMLWKWLPRYNGSELLLYRGENLDRFEIGRVGTAWSDQESVAKMFASGLNAEGRGGVILETTGPANSIIAGPSAHSIYLREYEYTIDTRRLSTISVICHLPPRHC